MEISTIAVHRIRSSFTTRRRRASCPHDVAEIAVWGATLGATVAPLRFIMEELSYIMPAHGEGRAWRIQHAVITRAARQHIAYALRLNATGLPLKQHADLLHELWVNL